MKITLAVNIKKSNDESEAEFDIPETVEFIRKNIESLSHQVTVVDVGCSVKELIIRLEDCQPELIFNLAEGSVGDHREAFYPALYEQLGYRYTGSGPEAMVLSANKRLASKIGTFSFKSVIFKHSDVAYLKEDRFELEFDDEDLWFVKPLFEGSSKGITQKSVFSLENAKDVLLDLIERYGQVLVEPYYKGIDISVAWVEGMGCLEPCSYHFKSIGEYNIYEYSLKRTGENLVEARVPAEIDDLNKEDLISTTENIINRLGIKGLARADFRFDAATNSLEFIEINPLPSLAPGNDAEMYKALALIGKEPKDLFDAVIKAAL